MTDQTPAHSPVDVTSIDVDALAVLTPEDADAADETGVLAGNQHYQDLQLCDAEDLQFVLVRETALMAAFKAELDAAAAESQFDGERSLDDERAALWHLDVGVASAVVALVVLGCHPVLSCNGGVFGNAHGFCEPHIRAYLGSANLHALAVKAQQAEVSLAQDDGLLVLTAASCEAFISFAHIVADAASSSSRVAPGSSASG